jgi:hypothetical protein
MDIPEHIDTEKTYNEPDDFMANLTDIDGQSYKKHINIICV